MSEKLGVCKACGKEIAKKAKTCPHCGAKNKKGHPILLSILVVFVLVGVFASGGDDEPKRVDGGTNVVSGQNGSSEQNENKEFGVGETVELNDVNVTLVGVTENTGSTYNKPTEGNVFVLCEFEIANNSDKEINVSSMMSFEAYCDDYTCNSSLAALMEKGNQNQLDGTVAAGKKFHGVIGYEVPANWEELEIRFTPDFISGKEIVFVAKSN